MQPAASIRLASPADRHLLENLINSAEYLYRHLDWRSPAEWLGVQPFLLITQEDRLFSALACPDDGAPVRWIRLFAYLRKNTASLESTWESLFQQVLLREERRRPITYAGLGLSGWFAELMLQTGFKHHQDIVALQWKGILPGERPLAPEIRVRPMTLQDIPGVFEVDSQAFEILWQMTVQELELALQQAAYATVAEMENQVIGYQITTGNLFHAHLARLAVHPQLQRLSIGYGLVSDLLQTLAQRGLESVTVNTQAENFSSLSLYEKAHFIRTGELFPVYVFSTS
jgi:ribosomal-protein-alanine N-acetyltransferase